MGLLASVPHGLLHRSVRYATRGQIEPIDQPAFIKPADPLAKTFDAGVYHDLRDLARGRPIPDDTPVLISDPVEWSSEFRCFILDGQIAAWSPYLSFGRTAWRPGQTGVMPRPLGEFVAELGVALSGDLPPAYVVDVGLLDGDQWAVVEFNPVWCSGILGADPDNVLTVIERAAMPIDSLPELDRRWLIRGDDGQSR
ncbi:MAG: ATP-grasp domain-containing protein [Planctomycetota bacterium]